ncbi:hypothetical protein PILCRDRAFT_10548 [Piloderma croceum F 1598]|uniref:Uncharacterized protein n=1 Tax=Piloderma croceum (strain F 1598) TaxID=765440 RepID=A0A0C3FH45_PILCF|nr:hypothetical protein PILCRDRAFT_10548 [Piloderma croceum F 1598]
MGQTCTVANIDKEQTMGCWSRSGCLLDGSADEIEKWTLSAWAGDRIICVGNDWWPGAGKLPDDVFTQEELTRLELDARALYDVAPQEQLGPRTRIIATRR